MITRVETAPYALPLRRRWRSARGALEERRGWLVRIADGTLQGYGDCAPLPAAGTEEPEAAERLLRHCRRACHGLSPSELLRWLDEHALAAPASRWAVECALLDLEARRQGLPLRALLDAAPRDTVAVNASLGALCDLGPAQLAEAARQGYRHFKVKVGIEDPVSELARLAALAPHLPDDGWFRLDANGAWDMAQAQIFLGGLGVLPIESLEEPLAQPTDEALRELQDLVPFSLALDESLGGGAVEHILDHCPVRRLILKPAVVGGMRRTLELARRACSQGLEAVLTSLLDSAAGLWPALQLAAALPEDAVHGLGTSGWLAQDLGEVTAPERGRIALPRRPGSGFRPIAGAGQHDAA